MGWICSHCIDVLHWSPVNCSDHSIWLPHHHSDRRCILCCELDSQLLCGEHVCPFLYIQSSVWLGLQLYILCWSGGILTVGRGGGVLVMSPTLEALVRATGWQTTYRIMAGVGFVLCSLAITFDPNVEKDEEIT